MEIESLLQKRFVILAFVLTVVFILICPNAAAGQGERSAAPVKPLELSVLNLPAKALVATASGGSPSNATITFTSTNGSFCIQGLVVSANPSTAVAAKEFGDVWINLATIDGYGLSHPYITLADGTTGGFSPYDIVLNYGGPICAAKTVQLDLIQWQASVGGGTTINVLGEAIISTASGNKVTVK
ncbi:MAG: hypothetical protein ACLQGT_09200 [Terracidiphilus sp.]